MSSESQPTDKTVDAPGRSPFSRGRVAVVFGCVALVWLAFDLLTKSYFNGPFAADEAVTEPIGGLFRFHLIHNTGMAWGMFDNATLLLGVFSLIVCALLVAYLFFMSTRTSMVEVVGVALVVSGGIGNAIDRFTLGYVVDFIEPVFIDFPVFNIADIGVTCGFVLLLLGMLLSMRHADKQERAASDPHKEMRS